MTKLKKFLSVLIIGMMLSGIISSAVPDAAAYAANEKASTQVGPIKSIRLKYPNYYLAPGYKYKILAQALDENGKFIKGDTFTWEMKGEVHKWDGNNLQEKENCTYLEDIDINEGSAVLHIADNEPTGEITITATSKNAPEISSSCTFSIETDEKIPVRMEMEMWKIVEEEGDEIGLQELESDGEKSFLEPGADAEIDIKTYTADGIYIWNYHDTFQWEIEGTTFPWEDISHMSEPVKERWTYFNPEKQILHIGTEKDLIEKEITLKATSKTNPNLCVYGRIAVRELPLTDCVILQKDISGSYADAGSDVEIFATAYDQKDNEIEDTFIWEIERTENLWDKNSSETPDEKYTYLNEEEPGRVILHIGTEEPDKRMIIIKATSEMNPEISDSLYIDIRKPEITKIEIDRDYEEYIKPGEEADILFEAHIYNQYDEEVEDTLTWSATYSDEKRSEVKVWDGNQDTQPNEEETYVQYEENFVWLHIGTKEPKRSSITVKAVSGSSPKVSAYSGVMVWEGAWLEFDSETLSARIRTNGDDSFLFMEIAKNEDMLWEGKATPYCYEGNDVTVDLSFLNISNEMYFRVYGDQNQEVLGIDQICAIPKEEKASLKYKHNPELYDVFYPYDLENFFGEDYGSWEYRHQGEGTWHPLWELEDELEYLRAGGVTLLVRQYMGDINCVPGKETKLKIPAAPKAPKVKLNYTKHTVTFTSDSEIFVSGWKTLAKSMDGDGYYEIPYYYYLEVDEEEDSAVKKWMLNPDIEWLAYDLAEDYVQSYNFSINMLRQEGIFLPKKTKEDEVALREELLTNGFKIVVRTNTQKKGLSQFVLKEINPVPAIEVVSGAAINKIAVVTVDEQGNKKYGDDYVTFQYGTDKKGNDILTLTSFGDKTFAYSTNYWDIDNPSKAKFTKIKTTGTVINLDKLKGRDITIRMEGVENKKDASKSRWASNVVDIPR